MDSEEIQNLQDVFAASLLENNPWIFTDPETKNLSLRAKGTFLMCIKIARKYDGKVPNDPELILKDFGCPIEVIPFCIPAIESDLEELVENGIIGPVGGK